MCLLWLINISMNFSTAVVVVVLVIVAVIVIAIFVVADVGVVVVVVFGPLKKDHHCNSQSSKINIVQVHCLCTSQATQDQFQLLVIKLQNLSEQTEYFLSKYISVISPLSKSIRSFLLGIFLCQ